MHLIDPTQKEIMAEQKEYLKGKGLKYKLEYFAEYYLKTTLIILAFLALIVSIVVTIATKKETKCQAVFINCIKAPDQDEFAAYAGIDTKEYEVIFDGAYYIRVDMADSSSYINLQKLVALITAKDVECIVGDYNTVYGYAASEFYGDLRDFFTGEELSALGDKVIYYYFVDEEGNLPGKTAPLFIDVTDSPILKKNDSFGEDRVLLTFAITTQRPTEARQFFDYLYSE